LVAFDILLELADVEAEHNEAKIVEKKLAYLF
jgi:hypothetical protein